MRSSPTSAGPALPPDWDDLPPLEEPPYDPGYEAVDEPWSALEEPSGAAPARRERSAAPGRGTPLAVLHEVWGYDFPTTANSLEVYVGYLRRKTEAEDEPRLIHTVRGVGYVLKE